MAQAQNPGKMVQVNLVDRTSIYNSYMSFLNNGGVFIASDDTFAMGDEVLFVLEVRKFFQLQQFTEQMPVVSQVYIMLLNI